MSAITSMLAQFSRRQAVYLAIAVLVYATLWATQGSTPDLLLVVFYSFALPNILMPCVDALRPAYENRRSPYNWLAFSVVLILGSAIAVVASTALLLALFPAHVRWQTGNPNMTFSLYLRGGWKVPFIFTAIVGAVQTLYRAATRRLEGRNRELQQAVDSEVALRSMHEQELQRAHDIQQALLPKQIPQIAGFDVAGAWEPARVVGGDYFDVLRLDENRLSICIADVVGKSVSAALLMANVQATVRAYASDTASPAELCSRANAVLCSNTADDKFVTLFYGVLDSRDCTFKYCNAGHSRPQLLRENGRCEALGGADGAVLGVFSAWRFHDAIVPLAPGDRLVLFTDGITEAMDEAGEEFGEQRMIEAARRQPGSAADVNAALLAAVKKHCRSHLQDDATLIVIAATAALTSATAPAAAASSLA